jgi:hypothetical protein
LFFSHPRISPLARAGDVDEKTPPAVLAAVFGIDNLWDKPMLKVAAIMPQILKFGSSCPHRLPIDLNPRR